MFTQDKRSPTLTDTDLMPFGKYRGVPMQDVPPQYLEWLKNQGCSSIKVANYIHNSWEAIEQELYGKQ